MRRKTGSDAVLDRQLLSVSRDGMDIFLMERGTLRGCLLHGTYMVNQMRVNHDLGSLETLVLGHAYIAAGLLSSQLKGQDRMAVSISCSGAAKGFAVECSAKGEVRGYLKQEPIPAADLVDDFDIHDLFGEGVLSVTKYLQDAKHPFTGKVSLEYGSPAEDLARYFVVSEQTPTAFDLSVKFDDTGRVLGAGGLFVQAMPGADEETLERMEDCVHGLPSIGGLFAEGMTRSEILHEHLSDFQPVVIGERRVDFFCPCSKERFARFLAALPDSEFDDIRENGPYPLVTTCLNCNTAYSFSREEIELLEDER